MEGGYVSDNLVEGFVKSIYEIENAASLCPEDCFTVYDDDGEEIEMLASLHVFLKGREVLTKKIQAACTRPRSTATGVQPD